jgi:hypothetical protein
MNLTRNTCNDDDDGLGAALTLQWVQLVFRPSGLSPVCASVMLLLAVGAVRLVAGHACSRLDLLFGAKGVRHFRCLNQGGKPSASFHLRFSCVIQYAMCEAHLAGPYG